MTSLYTGGAWDIAAQREALERIGARHARSRLTAIGYRGAGGRWTPNVTVTGAVTAPRSAQRPLTRRRRRQRSQPADEGCVVVGEADRNRVAGAVRL
jgi:hypothetical protein